MLGAYLVLLPHARVVTLLFGFLPLPISALLFLGFWFAFQLWQGGFSMTHPDAGGGVAFAAHVGGFAFGALTIRLFQVPRRSVLDGDNGPGIAPGVDSFSPVCET